MEIPTENGAAIESHAPADEISTSLVGRDAIEKIPKLRRHRVIQLPIDPLLESTHRMFKRLARLESLFQIRDNRVIRFGSQSPSSFFQGRISRLQPIDLPERGWSIFKIREVAESAFPFNCETLCRSSHMEDADDALTIECKNIPHTTRSAQPHRPEASHTSTNTIMIDDAIDHAVTEVLVNVD